MQNDLLRCPGSVFFGSIVCFNAHYILTWETLRENLNLKHVLNTGRYVNSAPAPRYSTTAFSGSGPFTWAVPWPAHLSLHHSLLLPALHASGHLLSSLALLFPVPHLNQKWESRRQTEWHPEKGPPSLHSFLLPASLVGI